MRPRSWSTSIFAIGLFTMAAHYAILFGPSPVHAKQPPTPGAVMSSASDAPVPPDFDLPKEIPGQPNTFIPIRPKTKGKFIVYYPLDDRLQVFPSDMLANKTQTVVLASTPGRYRLLAYSAVGNIPTLPAVTTIVVGNAPPTPPPNPDPNPTPPPVEDPLWSQVSNAYVVDVPADPQQKRNAASAYVAYYRAAAKAIRGSGLDVQQGVTQQSLWNVVNAVKPGSLQTTWLPGTRTILQDAMERIHGVKPPANKPVDSTTIKATADIYERFARLLEGAMNQ